jgi:3-oxocholest-4-en-26-oate---CoA ligase
VNGEQFNLGLVFDTVAGAVPDREALVWRDRRFTFAQLNERALRLASYLHGLGLGVRRERAGLANHESGQDHLALYLYNGNEYLDGMLGAYRARVAPFNVNYRYVEEELRYLLADAGARGVVYHARFAPVLAPLLAELPDLDVLLQVDDGSGQDLLRGAVDYETALAEGSPAGPPVIPSPDDLYILYTGGTTGMPKGVLWRQHDIFMGAMGGRAIGTWEEVRSGSELVERARTSGGLRTMPLPPLMHGAAQWATFIMLSGGHTIVLADTPEHLDADEVLRTVEREGVNTLTVVGDAMARPLADALERSDRRLDGLLGIGNGGAPLSTTVKERLVARLPNLVVSDSAGASETGAQMTNVSMAGNVSTGRFSCSPDSVVVNEPLDALLEPGHEGDGWLGQGGFVPLGYLGDPAKTARTFPEVHGRRYAIPGDRARLLGDGRIELLGRDAVTINSGGEKIFAEEVELAILHHPDVADVVVAGRPSERWGQEVVALVAVAQGASVSEDELLAEAGRHIARYKLPKAVVFLPEIVRSPAGKADYRWARQRAREGPGPPSATVSTAVTGATPSAER